MEVINGTTTTQNKDGAGMPVSRIETIQNNQFSLQRIQHINKKELTKEQVEKFRYKGGDIAFSHINSMEHVGKVALYENNPELFIHGMNLLRLRLGHNNISPKYLYYQMLTTNFREEVRKRVGRAVNQVSINQKNLSVIPLSIAPLGEQNRIVAKLDAILARVNNSKAKLEKVPTLLKNFRQSVLAAAVSGELTKEWREKNKNESVTSYKEFNKEAFKGNEGLPSEWSWMTLKDYLINLDTARVPISQELRQKRQGKYPYYGATGAIDTIDDYTHDGEFVLISEDGKNLQFRNKPICFLASGKIWVNNHAHVLQAKKGFQNRFVIYFISVTDLNPYLTGIDQVKLSQGNMNGILIPVPPKEEQKEIVRKVEELFHFADSIEARYQKAKAWFDKLPQSLLAKAFRGELVPQNENDEPASELLKRIKDEKLKNNNSASTKKKKLYKLDNDELSLVADG